MMPDNNNNNINNDNGYLRRTTHSEGSMMIKAKTNWQQQRMNRVWGLGDLNLYPHQSRCRSCPNRHCLRPMKTTIKAAAASAALSGIAFAPKKSVPTVTP